MHVFRNWKEKRYDFKKAIRRDFVLMSCRLPSPLHSSPIFMHNESNVHVNWIQKRKDTEDNADGKAINMYRHSGKSALAVPTIHRARLWLAVAFAASVAVAAPLVADVAAVAAVGSPVGPGGALGRQPCAVAAVPAGTTESEGTSEVVAVAYAVEAVAEDDGEYRPKRRSPKGTRALRCGSERRALWDASSAARYCRDRRACGARKRL